MSRPLYARMLRLRYLSPSGFLCFVFLEGAVALGILLALAELVSWWGVLVLPVAVATMVKLNDAVTGALIRPVPPPGLISPAPTMPVQSAPAVQPPAVQPAVQPYAVQAAVQWPGSQRPGVERLDVRQAEVWRPRVWESDPRSAPLSPAEASGYDEVSPVLGRTVEPVRPDGRSMPAVAEAEAMPSAINGSPSTRQWTDQIDTGQRRRQSANRRYS